MIFLLRMLYWKKYIGTVIYVSTRITVVLHSEYWISCYVHADQVLLKLFTQNERLSGPGKLHFLSYREHSLHVLWREVGRWRLGKCFLTIWATIDFTKLVPWSFLSSLQLTIMCDSEARCSPLELPGRTQRRTLIAASRKGIYFHIGWWHMADAFRVLILPPVPSIPATFRKLSQCA